MIARIKITFYIFLLGIVLTLISGCTGTPVGPSETGRRGLTEPLDPFKQNQKLGRGISIGNALEAPSEGQWGVTIKDEYFKEIREKGFNSVRIPVCWSAHAASDAPYIIDHEFFNRVDELIDQALTRGLAVILNVHHFDELMDVPAKHKEKFLALWKQISDHYAEYPGELVFEILNEPNGNLTPELWNVYLREAIGVIRQKNPYRTLMAGGGEWNSINAMDNLSIPSDEKNIIITFHYYNPIQFTHQGAEWVIGSDFWLGTAWSGTEDEKKAVADEFERALSWSKVNKRPVNIGEFGAYGQADPESRVKWTGFIARQAELRGFSWDYWEFCSGFGIYDQNNGEWNTPLLRALIPVSM